jgi:uracil phosphoribosyltransferase
MVKNLSEHHSLVSNWISELRDTSLQGDRMRFRRNIERIGEVAAYEISKGLAFEEKDTTTPLGIAKQKVLQQQPVLATILRAGMPLHQGMLNYFDKADSAFIAAYRKHRHDGSFEINLEYIACPPLDDRTVILCDPMLATGASLVKTIEFLKREGQFKEMHVVSVIACTEGIDFLRRHEPNVKIWCGAIDEELTAKGYIVPGLGDAGDLAFGEKSQS